MSCEKKVKLFCNSYKQIELKIIFSILRRCSQRTDQAIQCVFSGLNLDEFNSWKFVKEVGSSTNLKPTTNVSASCFRLRHLNFPQQKESILNFAECNKKNFCKKKFDFGFWSDKHGIWKNFLWKRRCETTHFFSNFKPNTNTQKTLF